MIIVLGTQLMYTLAFYDSMAAGEKRAVSLTSQADDEEPGVDVEGDDDDGGNSVEQDPNERPRKIRR